MIVEDDPDISECVQAVLQQEGYRVTAASTAEAALDLLLMGARPDLILLDLVMPGVGGFGFLREWRESAVLQSIPVVVMSAHCDPSGVTKLLGLAGSLSKPFHVEALLATLAQFTTD